MAAVTRNATRRYAPSHEHGANHEAAAAANERLPRSAYGRAPAVAARQTAAIEAMSLTDAQRKVFDKNPPTPRQSATQTPEQALAMAVAGLQYICALEGAGESDEADVLAEIELRWPGSPGDWTEPRRCGPPLPLKPSKTDPVLVKALYEFEPGEGPFGPRPPVSS